MRILTILVLLTGLVAAEPSPDAVAGRLYAWLQKAGDAAPKRLAEVQGSLTPDLYDQLTRAYGLDSQTGVFLDFDPWSNSQIGAEKYTLGPAKLTGGLAKVPVTVTMLGGGKNRYTCILKRADETWQVANLVYAPDFNLLSVLKDLLNQAK